MILKIGEKSKKLICRPNIYIYIYIHTYMSNVQINLLLFFAVCVRIYHNVT